MQRHYEPPQRPAFLSLAPSCAWASKRNLCCLTAVLAVVLAPHKVAAVRQLGLVACAVVAVHPEHHERAPNRLRSVGMTPVNGIARQATHLPTTTLQAQSKQRMRPAADFMQQTHESAAHSTRPGALVHPPPHPTHQMGPSLGPYSLPYGWASVQGRPSERQKTWAAAASKLSSAARSGEHGKNGCSVGRSSELGVSAQSTPHAAV